MAEIFNCLDRTAEQRFMEGLEEQEPEAAEKIQAGWKPFVLDVRRPAEAEIVAFSFSDLLHPHDQIQTIVDDLPRAQAIDRCLGSSVENAVGIGDDCIVNDDGLRYVDEFAKHKLLDAIGDLYLLGLPLLGAFNGYMSGHTLNNELARAVLLQPDAWELVCLDNRHVPVDGAHRLLRTVGMS